MRICCVFAYLLAAVLMSLSTPVGAKTLTGLDAVECFSGLTSGSGVYPLVVKISNGGQSTDGNIVIETSNYDGGGHRYLYPISLPTGSAKQVIAYPALSQGVDQLRVHFEGPHSSAFPTAIVPMEYGGANTRNIGLIGDKVGGMAALRQINSTTGYTERLSRFADSYALPENAPDRAAGYDSLTAVVISDGAERMSPAQWLALHKWVIGGGTVILLGGAEASFLRNPDAEPIVPLTNIHSTVFAALPLTAEGTGNTVGPVAAQTGDPKPGAAIHWQAGQLLTATERLGAGAVIFCAVNPLDQPIRSSGVVSDFWKQIVSLGTPRSSITEMRDSAEGNADYEEGGYGRYGGRYGGYYGGYDPQQNPFKIKLPATGTIAWLLIAYFVAVVPLTYFLLRKFKRLEWAWVTSPLISLLFAFGFYLFTADLYKASMSRRTSGILTAEAGNPSARFSGKTDIFFPRGGSYRIAIDSAETLEQTNGEGNAAGGVLETVNSGNVEVPAFSATNLAYRSIEHEQNVNLGGGVEAALSMKSDGTVTGTVTNATGKPLTGAMIFLPSRSDGERIGDISAGQSASVSIGAAGTEPSHDLDARGNPIPGTSGNPGYRAIPEWARQYTIVTGALMGQSSRTALLFASTAGDRFGPQIGRYVGTGNTVQVLVSIPLHEVSR